MMGANRSKVRSLKLDIKVWTEPLIQVRILDRQEVKNTHTHRQLINTF